MANKEHLAILRQGVAAWNAWRQEHSDVRPKLSRADLSLADLSLADLSGADLSGANLLLANLRGANLRGADLYEAMAFKADLSEANFSEADLRRANLSETDLRDTNFSGAHLRRANLSGAHLRRANLSGANLSGVDLSEADLSGKDLNGINLRGANLSEANLSEANLSEANLSGSILYRTLFGTVDLSTVTGLDTVEHRGPSMIGIDTLCLSQGKIPEAFLRGCGVPETLIKNLPFLLNTTQATTPVSENPTLSQEDIAQQQALLANYRRTLASYIQRLSMLSTAHAPPELTHGVAEARRKIARVKGILRASGVQIHDHPDDTDD
jgi:uncharacterized protein YjbI with pentapeptide repeats